MPLMIIDPRTSCMLTSVLPLSRGERWPKHCKSCIYIGTLYCRNWYFPRLSSERSHRGYNSW